ncbi:hypothetical protein FHX52_2408 [Humibacillus xanthopallidus]|uniref:DUF6916 domain-containing protein n=1 Tax=Humibacillus xanthopallidus TaxID=412689 RepID=A0A543PNQ5_9MICO|nr:hypothetical protein FHX52_2408 [Humibacillus xanthopallidus]
MVVISRRRVLQSVPVGVAAVALPTGTAVAAKAPSDPLSRSRFAGLVGRTFTLAGGAASWGARLDGVSDIVGAPAGSDTRFALLLSSSRAGGADGTYAMSRSGFTVTPIFVVASPDRRSWVATVNRT